MKIWITRRERGSAAIVLLLAVGVLVVMFAATLHVESVTASLTERQRNGEERARLNAKNAITDADEWLKGQVLPALEDIIRQMADQRVSQSQPALATAQFPTYSRRFQMYGSGCDYDDYADVTATLHLASPPLQRTLEGATAGGGVVRVDEYRFAVRMISIGHAKGDRKASFQHDATLLVELEVGPAS